MWNIVGKVKSERGDLDTIKEENCGANGLYKYEERRYSYNDNVEDEHQLQVADIELLLRINSSDVQFKNMTYSELNTAAEMFTYLKTCPHTVSLREWFITWANFHNDRFETQSADQVLLTLNRMMKNNSPKNKDGKIRAEKLFNRATTLLRMNYDDIQSMIPEKQERVQMGENHFTGTGKV